MEITWRSPAVHPLSVPHSSWVGSIGQRRSWRFPTGNDFAPWTSWIVKKCESIVTKGHSLHHNEPRKNWTYTVLGLCSAVSALPNTHTLASAEWPQRSPSALPSARISVWSHPAMRGSCGRKTLSAAGCGPTLLTSLSIFLKLGVVLVVASAWQSRMFSVLALAHPHPSVLGWHIQHMCLSTFTNLMSSCSVMESHKGNLKRRPGPNASRCCNDALW